MMGGNYNNIDNDNEVNEEINHASNIELMRQSDIPTIESGIQYGKLCVVYRRGLINQQHTWEIEMNTKQS